MDEFAVRSHQRSLAARQAGHLGEIVPVVDGKGNVYAEDDGVRADSSTSGLAKLKPFFDKKYGRVTPGNSSQITDGAAWLILASEEAVDKWGLEPLGKISSFRACSWIRATSSVSNPKAAACRPISNAGRRLDRGPCPRRLRKAVR